MRPIRILASGAAVLALLALSVGTVMAVPVTAVEGGAVTNYVAPDGTVTDGSITFGFLGSPEVIAADALLTSPVDTNLASLVGGVPLCLNVTRDSGVITALSFAAECTVSGGVTYVADAFGPGADGYAVSGRVIIPSDLLDSDPGLNALIKTAFDTGASPSLTFTADVTSGYPLSFTGTTQISGTVVDLGNGDFKVGAATLLDAVIDPTTRAVLEQAVSEGRNVVVDISGGQLIDLTGSNPNPTIVTLSAALVVPSPTPTAAATATATPSQAVLPDTAVTPAGAGPSIVSVALLLGLLLIVGLVTTVGVRMQR